MIDKTLFPRLEPTNHGVTSPESSDYNCIAWAAGDTKHWWQPGIYWPCEELSGEFGLDALRKAFETLGYEVCSDGALEKGFEKTALYTDKAFYTHAARQLSTGEWTSKLGKDVDIVHETPDDLTGGVYGEVALFMRRPLVAPADQSFSSQQVPESLPPS